VSRYDAGMQFVHWHSLSRLWSAVAEKSQAA
jgi:hypothetical protein